MIYLTKRNKRHLLHFKSDAQRSTARDIAVVLGIALLLTTAVAALGSLLFGIPLIPSLMISLAIVLPAVSGGLVVALTAVGVSEYFDKKRDFPEKAEADKTQVALAV